MGPELRDYPKKNLKKAKYYLEKLIEEESEK